MLYIHLFGHLRLFDEERPHTTHIPRRIHPLWAYLLLNRDRPLPRDQLAYFLYPDSAEQQALARLRRKLHELQRALPATKQQPGLLLGPATVQWNPAADYWLDVAEFERLSSSVGHLSKSLTLYTDDLLVNVYDSWLVVERQRLRNQYLANLRKLAAASVVAHDHQQAIVHLQQILAREPLSEDILAELLPLHYLTGNRAGALQTYEHFARLLKKELGVDPMPETQALYKTICQNQTLDFQPSRLAQAKPLKCPTNLPGTLNSFWGREQELLQLQRLLTSLAPRQRLVTITGVAGCGKTRLALQMATQLQADACSPFPDGIFFVDLSAVHQPEGVTAAMAQALNIQTNRSHALYDELATFLRHQHLLLVIDNFEQIVETGPIIAELLAAAPSLCVLVTSRIALNVYGEYEFALRPLPLPDLEEQLSTTSLEANPAVALFLARSAERNAQITLDKVTAPIIAEICVRLDGLPLAIELAANRARLLSPDAILAHLKDRLSFLSCGARNLPARQQALRTAIEWSYDLLGDKEKMIFAALGVFGDHWTLEAAQAVCAGMGQAEMLTALDHLTSQSLIDLHTRSALPRFGMISILREYALERLQEQALLQTTRQRHADYYIQQVEAASDEQHDPSMAWIQSFQVEIPNLQAILSWSLEAPSDRARLALGVYLSTKLEAFWSSHNQFQMAMAWYERQLRYRDCIDPKLQIKLLNAAGHFAQLANSFAKAKALHQEALELAQGLADLAAESISYCRLGNAAGRAGDYERARLLLERGIAIEQALNGEEMTWQSASACNNLAIVLKRQGNYARADQLLQQCVAYHRKSANEYLLAFALNNLGSLAAEQRDGLKAEAALCESLKIRHALGDQNGICYTIINLAHLALLRKQNIRAARLLGFHTMTFQIQKVVDTPANRAEVQRLGEHLLAELGEQDFRTALVQGQVMTFEQAVAYALETSPQATSLASEQGLPLSPQTPDDDEAAARWLETWWHPNGLKCPRCGASSAYASSHLRKSGLTAYRCQKCQKTYTLYTNTPLHGSHLRPSQVTQFLHRIKDEKNITALAHEFGISWRTAQKLCRALQEYRR